MKNLIILCGPPGAGKSTFSFQYEKENYIRISQDDHGKKNHLQLFKNAINQNKDIIVDRLNFNKEQRERYLKPAREAGYKTKIIILHVPKNICIQRCVDRIPNHPTVATEKDAKNAVACFFKGYQRVNDDEADSVERIYFVSEITKVNAIGCDLDGTMCNIDERVKWVKDDTDSEKSQKKNWPKFFSELKNDIPNRWCQEILWGLKDKYRVVFASGRPDSYKKETQTWLDEHYGYNYDLYMRSRDDYRKDEIVKEIILEFELLPRYNILCVIDDRAGVVAKWREHGIVALACAEGNY